MKESKNSIRELKREGSIVSNQEAIIKTFLFDSEDINSKNECGWTPLYRTIVAENDEATEMLLNMGADPDIKCNMGETALFQAVEMDRFHQVEILLSKGADPNIPQNDGRIPLHTATVKQNLQIVELLLGHGSNPNTQGKLYGQTPVHLAIKHSVKPTILLLLVKNGGSLIIKDKYDKKPTDYVETDEMRDTINMLKLQGEVPETPQKDFLLNTPSKLSKKDFLFIAKTLSDQKTRKDFENYISSNKASELHPFNIKINNLKLDDFLYQDSSSNPTNYCYNNMNDESKDREAYFNNSNYNNLNNHANITTIINNVSGFNPNNNVSENDCEIMHKKYLSKDLHTENIMNKEIFYEIIKQRSANSINFGVINNQNTIENNGNINQKTFSSNFISDNSILSGNTISNNNLMNMQNNDGINLYNMNINQGNPYISKLNFNNNNINLNFTPQNSNFINNEALPINISCDQTNSLIKQSSSNNDIEIMPKNIGNQYPSVSNAVNNIPRPEKNTPAVNHPNFVRNNSHFERLNSSHNSGKNSRIEIESNSNNNDSFNAIFNNSEPILKDFNFNNMNLNQQSILNEDRTSLSQCNNKPTMNNKELELDLEKKNSSKSFNSDIPFNLNHNNSELNDSHHSSSNENTNNNLKPHSSKNSLNNNYYYRSTYLPTIESKGSEFESEYEKDIRSQRNSNLNKNDERQASQENLVNKEYQNTDINIDDSVNNGNVSYEVNRQNTLKEIYALEKCYSQEIHSKNKENSFYSSNAMNTNKNIFSEKIKKQNSEKTSPIPEIENDNDQELNTSRSNQEFTIGDNERLTKEELMINNHDRLFIQKTNIEVEFEKGNINIKGNDNIENKVDLENEKTKSNGHLNFNEDSIQNSKFSSNSERERISDANPLDTINSCPNQNSKHIFYPLLQQNKENYNIINLSDGTKGKNNHIINSFHQKKVNKFNQTSDSIDEDEETQGNIYLNITNDFTNPGYKKNSKQGLSKEFYDELNFYGSPVNSNAKKSYIVSELNLTSNRKSKDSLRNNINFTSKIQTEKLDFGNFIQPNQVNNFKISNKKENLSSPSNLENSYLNDINHQSKLQIKNLKDEKIDNRYNKILNNNNISNSRSTNINSESHITQSHNYNNAFKTISNLKLNLLNNDNDQMISQMNLNILNSQRPKINSVDDKENFKNFSNSFVDPTPKNKIDYSCNKIDFNYNTNTKTSPRYQNSNNHSAFINSDINTYKKNCMNKSSLSPNSQKKINYFNTDICDISIKSLN